MKARREEEKKIKDTVVDIQPNCRACNEVCKCGFKSKVSEEPEEVP